MQADTARNAVAAVATAVGIIMFLFATPGLDSVRPGMRDPEKRAEWIREKGEWQGRAELAVVDFNREFRLPVLYVLRPLQRPFRLAQEWQLYAGGGDDVRRFEILADDELLFRSQDRERNWRKSIWTYRRIRPMVEQFCLKSSRNTTQIVDLATAFVLQDRPDTMRVEVRCTRIGFPSQRTRKKLRRERVIERWHADWPNYVAVQGP